MFFSDNAIVWLIKFMKFKRFDCVRETSFTIRNKFDFFFQFGLQNVDFVLVFSCKMIHVTN